ncbi:hypothetical protein [Pseudozobellia thermophila]|nr:hypothetical protein [Pseudozobellia thermophila]
MMAKLFSIVMSALILMQGLDIAVDDIVQFDELLEHAEYHAEKYGDNLLVFISKHYGELKEQHSKDHQEEKKEHEKLPFQNHSCCTPVIAVFWGRPIPKIDALQVPENRKANFFYRPPSSTLHVTGLFQPPRIA